MTGAEFSEVDIDLLADYVGGALDGTPDEAAVAARIADDPAWRAAYQELTGSMASVTAGLRALAAEPMPTDIAVRLTAALADLSPLTRPTAQSAALQSGAAQPDTAQSGAAQSGAARSGAAAVPTAEAAGSGGRRVTAVGDPHRRHRSKRAGVFAGDRRRWAGPIAVAAGALVVAGIGFGSLLTRSPDSASDTASTAGGAPAAPENAPMLDSSPSGARSAGGLAVPPAERQIYASGVDYQPGSLADVAGRATRATSPKRAPASAEDQAYAQQTPAGLERLTDRTALDGCLDAIARQNGDGAITVLTVDYARYQGDPAVVVTFRAGNGTWAWVSGPDCGTPGAAAATLNYVKVG